MPEVQKDVRLDNLVIGNQHSIVFIGGPCVIESESHAFLMAKCIKEITSELHIPFIFKASFDKANRSSKESFRGPGFEIGLEILGKIKQELQVPVLSDIHNEGQVQRASKILDVIQIPAFLCRQTDLLVSAGEAGSIVNVKKGQFLAPWDIKQVIGKVESTGNHRILITERGSSFGYNNLVSDMRSLVIMRDFGYPVVFDATHSVQLPGGMGHVSGGQSEFIPYLSRAAVAVGIAAVFCEVHDNPNEALCDGPNSLNLEILRQMLTEIRQIDAIVKKKK